MSYHIPVLVKEVLTYLHPVDGGKYLDGTLGLGGHTEALLQSCQCEVAALDRDRKALSLATARLAPFEKRFHPFHTCFAEFEQCLRTLGWSTLNGVLLDIGVSSMQLDTSERGFSFRLDAPLDMRMDQDAATISAKDIVNTYSESALRDIFALFGEEPNAARIAKTIVQARSEKTIATTAQLASLVVRSYPKSWLAKSRNHPATRVFQALRIAVNDELGQLRTFLERVLPYLLPGGRLVVITFHSLEDRLVKKTMQEWAKGCICPPSQLECVCGHTPSVQILTKKPITASEEECQRNSRATSAKLRAVCKL